VVRSATHDILSKVVGGNSMQIRPNPQNAVTCCPKDALSQYQREEQVIRLSFIRGWRLEMRSVVASPAAARPEICRRIHGRPI
jgi:hypothetical protein